MNNSLMDLNNVLFEQLERLQDDELDLDKECKRANAIKNISSDIIQNAQLVLQAEKFRMEYAIQKSDMPEMLESK